MPSRSRKFVEPQLDSEIPLGRTKVVPADHVPTLMPSDFGLPKSVPGFCLMDYYKTSGEAETKAKYAARDACRLLRLLVTGRTRRRMFIVSVYDIELPNLERLRKRSGFRDYVAAVRATAKLTYRFAKWLKRCKLPKSYTECEPFGKDSILIRATYQKAKTANAA